MEDFFQLCNGLMTPCLRMFLTALNYSTYRLSRISTMLEINSKFWVVSQCSFSGSNVFYPPAETPDGADFLGGGDEIALLRANNMRITNPGHI